MPSVASTFISNLTEDPVIFASARICLAGFAFLAAFLRLVPIQGPWKVTVNFTAHQTLAILLLFYQTYLGFKYWHHPSEGEELPPGIVTDETGENVQGGKYLSQVVIGSLLATIPLHLLLLSNTTELLMHIHHMAMFAVASCGAGLLSEDRTTVAARYAPFFFGVIELSSIFLPFVTIFNPHKNGGVYFVYAQKKKWLTTFNEVNRVVFALSYMILRVAYFPLVVFRQVVPDFWNKLQYSENEPYKLQLWIILVLSNMFTLLQWYWGSIVAKQIVKALRKLFTASRNEKTVKQN